MEKKQRKGKKEVKAQKVPTGKSWLRCGSGWRVSVEREGRGGRGGEGVRVQAQVPVRVRRVQI